MSEGVEKGWLLSQCGSLRGRDWRDTFQRLSQFQAKGTFALPANTGTFALSFASNECVEGRAATMVCLSIDVDGKEKDDRIILQRRWEVSDLSWDGLMGRRQGGSKSRPVSA
jgi:hypothetical protein